MKKLFFAVAAGLLLSACGISNLSPEPPDSVTNPQMLGTYQKAVAGDVTSLRTIAECYKKGSNGFPRNRSKVLSCKKMLAERGDVQAQSELGRAYLHGIGCSQSDSQARRWLSLAASQGDVQAQRSLRHLNIKAHNEGVIRDSVNSIDEAGNQAVREIYSAPTKRPVYVVY